MHVWFVTSNKHACEIRFSSLLNGLKRTPDLANQFRRRVCRDADHDALHGDLHRLGVWIGDAYVQIAGRFTHANPDSALLAGGKSRAAC